MSNSKYCPLPWIFQAIRNNGDIRVCCQANASESRGIYRKENGEAYNANRDSLLESRNSELAKEIRKSMLEDRSHEACQRCDKEDAAGIRSRRQYEVKHANDFFNLDKAKSLTNEDGSIDPQKVPLHYVDFRFGNKCNLKCRMCGPTDSDAWYDDYVGVWGVESYDDSQGQVKLIKNEQGRYKPEVDDYAWIDNDHFWNQMGDNLDHLQLIHTVGGEPMLIEKHYELLQKAIDRGIAKNITVEYNSNITVFPPKVWEIWKHFKQIQIGMSLDATGSANDYIRYPAKWNTIEKNIKKLEEADGHFNLWIATTVQIYNVLELPKLMKWRLEQDFKRINIWYGQPIITTHPLHNPRHLNVKILPKKAKEQIKVIYDEFYPWLEEFIKRKDIKENEAENLRFHAHKILDGYVEYMNADDWSDTLPKFWKYTKALDNLRGESFEQTLPDLYELIKNDLPS